MRGRERRIINKVKERGKGRGKERERVIDRLLRQSEKDG